MTIQITTLDDLLNTVFVTDPLLGCLEAMDPHIGPGGPRHNPMPFGTAHRPQWPVYAPMNCFPSRQKRCAFPAMEVHEDEVTFMARSLRAGSYTVVVTSGSRQMHPTKA